MTASSEVATTPVLPAVSNMAAPAMPAAYPRLVARPTDEFLPSLKDSEARLLLVLLRETAGRGKAADWLTHGQLKARTGRAGEAVSAAVDALVQRGLLTVRDSAGRPLASAAARRGAGDRGGKLWYSLGRSGCRSGSEPTTLCRPLKAGHLFGNPERRLLIREYRSSSENRRRHSARG